MTLSFRKYINFNIYIFLFIFISFINLNASYLEVPVWQQDKSFLEFLEEEELPLDIYHNLDKQDKRQLEDIPSKSNYYILRDYETQKVLQVLIPLSVEVQLHIYKNRQSHKYFAELIPIEYQIKEQHAILEVEKSPYIDIRNKTNSNDLAMTFLKVFKNKINFKREIQKGDKIAILYNQYYRLGEPFGDIDFKIGMIESNSKRKYAISFNEKILNWKGETKKEEKFITPVKNPVISSPFSKRRWHPILRKYRAHSGVDFAARRGTPVYATAGGVVTFVGWKGGYGKVIKIKHNDSYLSLYAHLSRFKSGLTRGQKISQGQLIGYIGSTGYSTGPHLHFGIYYNEKAIDPMKVVSVTNIKKLKRQNYKKFLKLRTQYQIEIQKLIKDYKDGLAKSDKYTPMPLTCVYYTEEEMDYNSEELELSEEYLSY
jgi:murein DD-endopeptidase MepM/ murein hydrolase activator NlpD